MGGDEVRVQRLQELRAAVFRLCDEILAELDRGRLEQDERIADFIKHGEIRMPWRQLAIPRFLFDTVGKIFGGALFGTDAVHMDFKPLSEYREEEAACQPKPMTGEAREMLSGVLEKKPIQDDINRKIGENVKALREKVAADDESLLFCYRSLLKAQNSGQEKDLGILEEVLRENGVEPAYTMQLLARYNMTGFDFKLKRRIWWWLATEEFQQLLQDDEADVHLCL